jgi:hypothetical protein
VVASSSPPAVRPAAAAPPAAPAAAVPPAASLGRPEPIARLGRPTPREAPAPSPAPPPLPVSLARPSAPGSAASAAAAPDRTVTVVRAQAPEGSSSLSGPPPVPAPGPDAGLPPIVPSDGYNAGTAVDQPLNKNFFDRCREWFAPMHSSTAGAHGWFQSDPCFGGRIISPLSNPFFFEDPQAVTELRPLFFYQHFPDRVATGGGNGEFYGVQGRLAFNEQWSLVVNKFGIVSLHPKFGENGFSGDTGFAELWFGPKWTFLRSEQTGTVVATGLTLELPIGSRKVFQDTGDFGLDPYITAAQSFGKTSYGAFNAIGELGFSFSADNKRSEFLHGSLHLDYDIANLQTFYPLIEVNWFHYTRSGKGPLNGLEGTDFVNFGSTGVSGQDLVTLALGMRYKFCENIQLGVYGEVPLTDRNKQLMDYRLGLDMIFRY